MPVMVGSNGQRMLELTLPTVDSWNTWFTDFGNRPERFAVGAPEIPRGAFMPFGAGARVCLGQHLAMAEMTVARQSRKNRNTTTIASKAPSIIAAIELLYWPLV